LRPGEKGAKANGHFKRKHPPKRTKKSADLPGGGEREPTPSRRGRAHEGGRGNPYREKGGRKVKLLQKHLVGTGARGVIEVSSRKRKRKNLFRDEVPVSSMYSSRGTREEKGGEKLKQR